MAKLKKQVLGASLLSADGAHAVELVNLRPAVAPSGNTVLHTAGSPKSAPIAAGMTPALMLEGGKCLLAGNGNASLCDLSKADMPTVAAGNISGQFLCALAQSRREGLLMCSDGINRVEIEGDTPTITESFRSYPSLRLMAVDAGTMSAGVGERTLSQTYGSGILKHVDAEALSEDLARAYRRLCSDAAAGGYMVQPVLARYRLYGPRGEELYTSAPVLLSHSSGPQCTEFKDVYSSDRRTVKAYTLEASVWQLQVLVEGDASGGAASEVSRADIFFTPMFHPYHPDFQGNASATRVSESTAPFARVELPGRTCGLSSGNAASRSTLLNVLRHIDELERCTASISQPFSQGQRQIKQSVSAEANADVDARKIRSAGGKSIKARDYRSVMLSMPHRFTAKCAASAGGAVAYGNVTAIRSRPYSAFMCGSGNIGGLWRAIVGVRFSDGSGTIISEEHSGNAPSSLGALLSYPAPDAVEMMVIIYSGGSNHKGVFPLSDDGSGERSVYVSPDFRPISLAPASAVQSVDYSTKNIEFAETVAFAPSDNILQPKLFCDAGSAVAALAARTGFEQTWEFGRSRFIVGARGGLFSAAVNVASGSRSFRKIADATIERPDAVCRTDSGDIFAVTDNSILHISPSGSARVAGEGGKYVAVAYDEQHHELHALRSDGTQRIFCRKHAWRAYDCTAYVAESFSPWCRPSPACGNRRMYLLEQEGGKESTRVKMVLENVPAGYALIQPRCVRIAAQCSSANIETRVRSCGVSRLRPFTLRAAHINGAIAGAMTMTLASRPVRSLGFEIEGLVSSDFTFDCATIVYDCQ